MHLINKLSDKLDKETADYIVSVEETYKKAKAQRDALRAQLIKAMENNKVKSLENENIKITYLDPSDREIFNKAKFREENQELYDEYITMQTSKPSVRLMIK